MTPKTRPHPAAILEPLDVRIVDRPIMSTPIESSGFTPPAGRGPSREGRRVALAELVAIVGLALSTIVAATVVSVGIARANVVGNVIDNEDGVFTVALLLGLIFIAMGGLTVFTVPGHKAKKR
jgi:hypothetical protein